MEKPVTQTQLIKLMQPIHEGILRMLGSMERNYNMMQQQSAMMEEQSVLLEKSMMMMENNGVLMKRQYVMIQKHTYMMEKHSDRIQAMASGFGEQGKQTMLQHQSQAEQLEQNLPLESIMLKNIKYTPSSSEGDFSNRLKMSQSVNLSSNKSKQQQDSLPQTLLQGKLDRMGFFQNRFLKLSQQISKNIAVILQFSNQNNIQSHTYQIVTFYIHLEVNKFLRQNILNTLATVLLPFQCKTSRIQSQSVQEYEKYIMKKYKIFNNCEISVEQSCDFQSWIFQIEKLAGFGHYEEKRELVRQMILFALREFLGEFKGRCKGFFRLCFLGKAMICCPGSLYRYARQVQAKEEDIERALRMYERMRDS